MQKELQAVMLSFADGQGVWAGHGAHNDGRQRCAALPFPRRCEDGRADAHAEGAAGHAAGGEADDAPIHPEGTRMSAPLEYSLLMSWAHLYGWALIRYDGRWGGVQLM
jgi:hypothetical protein